MSWPRWDTENNFCLEKHLFSHSLIYVLIESAFSKVNSDYSYLVRRSLRRHEHWKFFLVPEKALRGTNKCAVLRSETYGKFGGLMRGP
ncbi:hypothetical protein PAPYR_6849 [Paratrimastix pyriformis]|uniref:Uncharacterized protein n=1 Tax=Paratrimastix pyriformis TaxID=342808 RepID=A0ABQ8UIS0_9EUKA|nr:hypothetical protein PAPYR_6849 [Paratrimastix pyriformis]